MVLNFLEQVHARVRVLLLIADITNTSNATHTADIQIPKPLTRIATSIKCSSLLEGLGIKKILFCQKIYFVNKMIESVGTNKILRKTVAHLVLSSRTHLLRCLIIRTRFSKKSPFHFIKEINIGKQACVSY